MLSTGGGGLEGRGGGGLFGRGGGGLALIYYILIISYIYLSGIFITYPLIVVILLDRSVWYLARFSGVWIHGSRVRCQDPRIMGEVPHCLFLLGEHSHRHPGHSSGVIE